jgi:hypothetical protein
MKVLVTYADKAFRQIQKLNRESAIRHGRFDRIRLFGPRDIDPSFRRANEEILVQKRGGGYWLWKPYFIHRTLTELKMGDLLMYCDSGALFIDDPQPLLTLCENARSDVISFELAHAERTYTKRDAFVLLGCDTAEYTDTQQRLASFIILRQSDFSLRFAAEWLHWAKDARALSDSPNTLGLPNHEGFIDHRHDQSLFSLLAKKHRVPAFRDPSQWGNDCCDSYPNSTYPQIIDHVRGSAAPKPWWQKLLNQIYREK